MKAHLSYVLCYCGMHCAYEDTEGEPCWGEVTPADHDGDDFVHACAGHVPATFGKPYRPKLDPRKLESEIQE